MPCSRGRPVRRRSWSGTTAAVSSTASLRRWTRCPRWPTPPRAASTSARRRDPPRDRRPQGARAGRDGRAGRAGAAWGLAAGGEDGAQRVLELLRDELELALRCRLHLAGRRHAHHVAGAAAPSGSSRALRPGAPRAADRRGVGRGARPRRDRADRRGRGRGLRPGAALAGRGVGRLLATPPLKDLYVGASGVIWALDALRRRGLAETSIDLAAAAADARGLARVPDYASGIRFPARRPRRSCRRGGPLIVAWRLAPSSELADELYARVRENVGNEAVEIMWGAPGTMLAAQAMLEWTGEERWAERGGRAPSRSGRRGRRRPVDEPAVRRDVPQPRALRTASSGSSRSQAGPAPGAARARDRRGARPHRGARGRARELADARGDGRAATGSSGVPARPGSSPAPRPTSTRSSCSPGPS